MMKENTYAGGRFYNNVSGTISRIIQKTSLHNCGELKEYGQEGF